VKQRLVGAMVYRLSTDSGRYVTSLEVTEGLAEHLDTEVDRADVSRTLLRATRGGRLRRYPGHTEDGGGFRYEYALTRKGSEWLRVLRERRQRRRGGEDERLTSQPAEADAGPTGSTCDQCDVTVASEDRFCRMCGVEFAVCEACDHPLSDGECPCCCE